MDGFALWFRAYTTRGFGCLVQTYLLYRKYIYLQYFLWGRNNDLDLTLHLNLKCGPANNSLHSCKYSTEASSTIWSECYDNGQLEYLFFLSFYDTVI